MNDRVQGIRAESRNIDPPSQHDPTFFIREKEAIIEQLSAQETTANEYNVPASLHPEKEAIIRQLREPNGISRNNIDAVHPPRTDSSSARSANNSDTLNHQLRSKQASRSSNINGMEEGRRRPGAYSIPIRVAARAPAPRRATTNNESNRISNVPPEHDVMTADIGTARIEAVPVNIEEENETKSSPRKWIAISLVTLALTILAIGLGVGLSGKNGGRSSTSNGASGGGNGNGGGGDGSNNDVFGDRWVKYGETQWGIYETDFGESIDLNGDATRLAIGANRKLNDNSGEVVVKEYQNSKNDWELLGNPVVSPLSTQEFGGAVKLNDEGNILVVGARGDRNSFGSVSTFQYDPTSGEWPEIGQSVQGLVEGDSFGEVLSMASNKKTWITGAREYKDMKGYAQVYEMQDNGGNWTQKGSTIFGVDGSQGEEDGSQAGRSVAMSGDGNTICVGEIRYVVTDSFQPGRVRCFTWSSSENDWKLNGLKTGGILESAYDGILGPIHDEDFGYSLALNDDGTVLAVGSSRLYTKGAVRVYKLNTTFDKWEPYGQGFSGEKDDDRLGHNVALNGNGNVLAFTSRFFDKRGLGEDTGIVKIRRWEGDSDGDGKWLQLGDSDLPGVEAGDHYGEGLSLSNDGTILASSANWVDLEYVSCYRLQ